MNCYNHSHEPAVAQCTDCGKGLCRACADLYRPILCPECAHNRGYNAKQYVLGEARWNLMRLALLGVAYLVGYWWAFFAHHAYLSGYILLALGCSFVLLRPGFFSERVVVRGDSQLTIRERNDSLLGCLFGTLFRLLVGFVAAPLVILWLVYKVLKGFNTARNTVL